ncbi:MAG: pyridoxal phosphate-dependent aminotransferase [Myxococcales bacterium]|nr:pyridoxal phosphate-dependent aminotransferase [Myxococcales bacterium]
MFSDRTARSRAHNALALAVEERARRDPPLLDLTVSNPTAAGLPYDAAAIREALGSADGLRYAPNPLGLEPARRAVAEALRLPGADHVVLTASTSEAYAFLFTLLCDPGDDVLVPRPSYPLIELLAGLGAVTTRPYDLRYDGEWYLDAGSLDRVRTPRTRALLSVSPNNPTGGYLRQAELEAALDRGLPVVVDAVFARYALDGCPEAAAPLDATRGLVFTMGGLSKHVGLPQMKLAWIVVSGEPALRDEAIARLELIADSFLSVSTPTQAATPALLRHGRVTADAIAARTARNLRALRAGLDAASPATCLRVEGGWYAPLRLPRTQSDDAWAHALLEVGVRVQPGWLYDFATDDHLVVSLLTEPSVFDEGIERLHDRLARG